MPGNLTADASYIRGVICRKDKGYLILSVDAMVQEHIPHSVLVLWRRGEFFKISTEPWNIAGVDVLRFDKDQMIAVGEYGNVVVAGAGELHRETIGEENGGPRQRGPLRGAKVVGEHVYAVGMKGQIYRRLGKNSWSTFSTGVAAQSLGFEAIDGFDESEMYTVGWGGEIWWFDGRAWKPVDSPTNLILTNVCCGTDGSVYATGQQGVVLKGRRDQWETLAADGIAEDIWGMAWYSGSLYLATFRKLWRGAADGFVPVGTGNDPARTFYSLSARDTELWSIGAKDVMAFDGAKWTRIS